MTEKRSCKICKKTLTYGKPDPCLGMLPGVEFACCGHGETDMGYVKFENGICLYFDTQSIADWNNFDDDTMIDPETGGVWISSLDPIIFREDLDEV